MTSSTVRVYQQPEDTQISDKIKARWGLGRLLRDNQHKAPLHGDSVLLSQILRVSRTLHTRFPERTVRRVINSLKVSKETKDWLLTQGGYK